MYNAMHGTYEVTTIVKRCHTNGSCNRDDEYRELQLANGLVVENPDDVLPLVLPQSETAAHAHDAVRSRHRRTISLVVGTTAALAAFVALDHDGWFDTRPGQYVFVGGFVTAIVAGVMAWHYRDTELEHASAAYHSYNDDLAARLGVCAAGLQVVACEAYQPGGAPPGAR